MPTPLHTGGCQCGAVRYALHAEPTGASICHCRMCQKAVGNYFAALAGVRRAELTWTRGKPGTFASSAVVERGFCRDCGTPLTFRYTDRDRISITIGSLDHPERVHPAHQYGQESCLPDFARLAGLPGTSTDKDETPERLKQFASRQHPDRDTPEGWTPPPLARGS